MRIPLLIICCFAYFSINAQETIECTINTSKGIIQLELYPEQAPITVANFLKYVDTNAYENSSFFRVCTPENEAERTIKIEVIQGGNIPENSSFDPIKIETTKDTGILHKNGVISMARSTPNSATSSFFICVGDQPSLDFEGKRNPDGYGFAAFGKVISGMEVVIKIQEGTNTNQMLETPVLISTIKRN